MIRYRVRVHGFSKITKEGMKYEETKGAGKKTDSYDGCVGIDGGIDHHCEPERTEKYSSV